MIRWQHRSHGGASRRSWKIGAVGGPMFSLIERPIQRPIAITWTVASNALYNAEDLQLMYFDVDNRP